MYQYIHTTSISNSTTYFLILPGPQSRSLNGDKRSHADDSQSHPRRPNVVIAASPQKDYGSKGYSIYGSPDINYSALYDQPAVKLQTHDTPKPNGREEPYLIFQRDYFNSANSSRAADDGKFEQQLLLSPQLAKLAKKNPRFANKNRPFGPRIDLGGGGGGIKYIDPPNRKQNDYFYYSEDHPRYNKNANLLRSRDPEEKTVKHPYSFDKGAEPNPKGVEIEIGEHRGNAGGIDRTEINVNPSTSSIDIITADDLEGRESVQTYSRAQPEPKSEKESSLISVYSFTNKHGQKENVGIIYDQSSLRSPQINNIFDSQKSQIDYSGLERSSNVYQSIPFNANRQQEAGSNLHPSLYSKNVVPNGSRAPPKSIPLDRRPASAGRKVYPLGNPRSPSMKSRPEYFKPQPRPPIYKIRPHKLEGVFGPALPPRPEPTRIRLPDDYSIDYRDQNRKSQPPTPHQLENIYGRKAYETDVDYINKPPFRPQARTNYQSWQQPSRSVRRGDFGVTDRSDVNSRDVVYKRVRDMDYSRPQVILHVKDSGELFLPDPSAEHMPMYDKNPRVEITPGHGTLKEYLARKEKEQEQERLEHARQERLAIQRQKDLEHQQRIEAERVRRSTTQITTSTTQTTTTISPEAWLADFSDSMPDDMKGNIGSDLHHRDANKAVPVQSSHNNLYQYQPLDLESEPSETVIFRDTDIHGSQSPNNSPSNSFKFPSSPSDQERKPSLKREFRDVSSFSTSINTNSVNKQSFTPPRENENIVTHTKIIQRPQQSPEAPNYNVVIGLSYDDDSGETRNDYDFDDNTNEISETTTEKQYSRSELYQICIFEVPEYLKKQLCGGILEGRSQQFINRRSDFENQKENGRKEARQIETVVVPPRASQLLQGKENVQEISYNIVNTEGRGSFHPSSLSNADPNELKKLKGKIFEKLITNNLEKNQQHPPAVIITSNSKVKTYGAIAAPSIEFTVSTPNLQKSPVFSAKTTTEKTITTTTQGPWKIISPASTSTSSPVSPATYNTNTPTSSPIQQQFKPQVVNKSPSSRRRPADILSPRTQGQQRRRPLRFRKRNKQNGTVQTSKPFEYFTRLAQHLGNRLQTPPPRHRRRSTTTPPSIVRQRIRQNT